MHRDAVLILLALVIALIAGSLLMFSFKEGALAPTGPASASFSVIAQGVDSGELDDRKNFRIKNDEELAALWVLVYGTSGPNRPRVDFSKEELLAVFAGTRPSGGYGVSVDSIIDEPGKRTVTISHTVPGASCVVTNAITSPFTIVRVAKSAYPLSRNDQETVIECE